MAKKSSPPPKLVPSNRAPHVQHYAEAWGIFCFGAVLLTFLSLVSYDANDIGFNTTGQNLQVSNAIGQLGAYWSYFLFLSFGMAAYLVPLLFLSASVVFFLKREVHWQTQVIWACLLLVAFCGLLDLQHGFGEMWRRKINVGSVGGFFGENLNLFLLVRFLGKAGAAIILSSMAMTSLIFLYRLKPIEIAIWILRWASDQWERHQERKLEKEGTTGQIEVAERKLRREQNLLEKSLARQSAAMAKAAQAPPAQAQTPAPRVIDTSLPGGGRGLPAEKPEKPARKAAEAAVVEVKPDEAPLTVKAPAKPLPEPKIIEKKSETAPRKKAESGPAPVTEGQYANYVLPSVDLLKKNAGSGHPATTEAELIENAKLLVSTLETFGIEVTRGDITKGATITRYEVYPASGVRVDRIVSLQRDLARALKAERINILAPIPGKDSVGIEIPNTSKVPVVLRDLFETPEWISTEAKIPLALGKDVYGETLVADLAAMPHLLIAGTTGSGKSVCINSILLSILYKFTPAELRLILVDPKQVEMQIYNTAPHLVVPVVVDPKKVLVALNWVIKEMEKRYRLLAQTGVRNIAAFNDRDRAKEKEKKRVEQLDLIEEIDADPDNGDDGETPNPPKLKPMKEEEVPDRLPYIVVIIDELADLMQTTGADVETAIVRLCQKARAAGIHLIVATQTPRREVITSLIKTNIPSRVAFQVPSSLDSRVILDENGAENLLGKGDMLYLPPGSGKTLRGQGAFVSDGEVQAVVDFVGGQVPAAFEAEIHRKLNPGGAGASDEEVSDEDKELVRTCLETIREEKRASTSMLQRRLRLGYNRAAWVVDFLERNGVLGAENGAKPRDILIDLDQFDPETLFGG